MPSTAISSQGTLININTSTSTTMAYVAIGNVKEFSGFDGSAAELDKTNLSSSAKELMQGLPDWGNFTVSGDWDSADAGQAALRANYVARTAQTFQVLVAGSSGTSKVYTFSAFVKKFSLSGGVDKILQMSADLRITGGVTLA